MKNRKTPVLAYTLIIAMIFLAISGLLGGCMILYDPSGDSMNMPLNMLEGTPFRSYLIPGLILLFLMGLFPGFVTYGLIKQPECKWAEVLNLYKDQHWAWTYSLYVSIMLIIWIDVQIMLIGYGSPIQIVYAFFGVVLLILTLVPIVKNYYSKNPH